MRNEFYKNVSTKEDVSQSNSKEKESTNNKICFLPKGVIYS